MKHGKTATQCSYVFRNFKYVFFENDLCVSGRIRIVRLNVSGNKGF